jgi:hypothetical protein
MLTLFAQRRGIVAPSLHTYGVIEDVFAGGAWAALAPANADIFA